MLAEVLCKHKVICKYQPLPSLGFRGPHARLPQYWSQGTSVSDHLPHYIPSPSGARPMFCPSLSLELSVLPTPVLGCRPSVSIWSAGWIYYCPHPPSILSPTLWDNGSPHCMPSRWDHPSTCTPSPGQWGKGPIDVRHDHQTLLRMWILTKETQREKIVGANWSQPQYLHVTFL